MGASVQPETGDRITRTIDALRKQGASEHDIEMYLTEHEGIHPVGSHSKFTPAQLTARADRQVVNAQDAEGVDDSTGAARALGTVAAVARDIPGAEIAQAGLRSLVRTGVSKAGFDVAPESYRESLANIRGAEDASRTSGIARVAGGALAASAIPGGASAAGGRYGVLRGLLQADPDVDASARIHDAAAQGVLGRVLPIAASGLVSNLPARVGGGALRSLVNRVGHAKTMRDVGQFTVLPEAATEGATAEAPVASQALVDIIKQRAPATVNDVARALTKNEAKGRLAQLLQKNLDEGMAEAAPAEHQTNWALMEKIEKALKGPNDKRIIPGIRNSTGDLRHLNSLLPPPP